MDDSTTFGREQMIHSCRLRSSTFYLSQLTSSSCTKLTNLDYELDLLHSFNPLEPSSSVLTGVIQYLFLSHPYSSHLLRHEVLELLHAACSLVSPGFHFCSQLRS